MLQVYNYSTHKLIYITYTISLFVGSYWPSIILSLLFLYYSSTVQDFTEHRLFLRSIQYYIAVSTV